MAIYEHIIRSNIRTVLTFLIIMLKMADYPWHLSYAWEALVRAGLFTFTIPMLKRVYPTPESPTPESPTVNWGKLG